MQRTCAMTSMMADEQFHTIEKPLRFSTEKLQLRVKPGEVREGSFMIYGDAQCGVNGFVSSSRLAMTLVTETFSGAQDAIGYRFDARAFESGDVVEGYFRIVSNQGEYSLPFNVEIRQPSLRSSNGVVKNLFHFSNLAKASWHEAVELFYDPAFGDIFTPEQNKEYLLYRGLSGVEGNEQNVEEFLVSACGKAPVTYLPSAQRVHLEITRVDGRLLEYQIRMQRNGWGYTHLQLSADGSFLQLPQEELLDIDFAGENKEFPGTGADLRFFIDPSLLHEGMNFGSLQLETGTTKIVIPVEVLCRRETEAMSLRQQERRQILCRLMLQYEAFRAKKIKYKEWIAQSNVLIERMGIIDPANPYSLLYQAHLLIFDARKKDARAALDKFMEKQKADEEAGRKKENMTVLCYQAYLSALCTENRQDTDRTCSILENQLRRKPGSWQIAWMLMNLSERYKKRPSAKWQLLREQFGYGCRSPLLYIEAYELVSMNPAILSKLDDFEQQTLLYAAKKGYLSSQVMTQVNILTRSQRAFSSKLLRVLLAGYQLQTEQKETLESICMLLIKGNITDTRAFSWYQKGVEAQLQVTRLYEYYMLSLPDDFEGTFPQAVLLYFCYQSTLPWEKNARLYRFICEQDGQMPDLYRQYEPEIQRFTMLQLSKQRMNEDLNFLYRRFLTVQTITGENAADAARALFGCVVRTSSPLPKQVVVIYEDRQGEEKFPVENGCCYLPLYGEKQEILFEDSAGNRYASTMPCFCDRAKTSDEMTALLARFDTELFDFEVYLAGLGSNTFAISGENCGRFKKLTENPLLQPALRQKIRLKLLNYYNDNDCIRELDKALNELTPDDLHASERADLIRFMMLRGINDKAVSWLRRYGTFGVDEHTLMHLCSRVLAREEVLEDEAFANIVFQSFQLGKYDEKMLSYLARCLEGLSTELWTVREAMVSFEMDTSFLAGRMLRQILYSGQILPQQSQLLEDYRAGGADQELMAAVLAQSSHEAFMKQSPLDSVFLGRIQQYGVDGVPLLDICRIAYLYTLSERAGGYSAPEEACAEMFLEDLCRRDIIFSFFTRFTYLTPLLSAHADQTMAQYQGRSGAHVCIHYALEQEDGTIPPYECRDMREMYEGIYVTGFVLFFGDQLLYYITDDAEEKNVVESGSLGQDIRMSDEEAGRFGRLNQIASHVTMREYDKALGELERYDKLAHMVMGIFENTQE